MPDEESQGLNELTQGVADVQGTQPPASSAPGEEPAQGAATPQSADTERKLSAEAAAYRRRVRELEAKLREYEEAQMSEQERLRKRLAELEREQAEQLRHRQELVVRYEAMLAAQKLGIVDPDAAYRLMDLAAIEFDDDGRPTNVEAVMRQLLQQRPYLAPQSQLSPSNPATGGRPGFFTRSQLRDPKFFQEHRDEIMRAVAEGRILED